MLAFVKAKQLNALETETGKEGQRTQSEELAETSGALSLGVCINKRRFQESH